MKKAEFVKAVAENAGSTQIDAERFINAVIAELTNALAKGESVQFIGFGSFCVNTRGTRTGRNPRTGEQITIPSYKQACFKQGNLLKQKINSK